MPREQFDLFRPKPKHEVASPSTDEPEAPMPTDASERPTEADEREAFEQEYPGATYIAPKTRAERDAARKRREELLRQGRVDILGEPGQPSLPTKPRRGR